MSSDHEPISDEVVIARIVKARGIRGEVACTIETDFPNRFSSLKEVAISMPNGARLQLELDGHWFHRDRVILKFGGCDSRTQAEALVGGQLLIPVEEQASLPAGEFFEHQVIGAEAVTTASEHLGRVTGILRTGGTDVLVVRNGDGRERLIPFADEICTDIDVAGKRITIDPPEGLLDL